MGLGRKFGRWMDGSAKPQIEHMYPPKYQVPPRGDDYDDAAMDTCAKYALMGFEGRAKYIHVQRFVSDGLRNKKIDT